MQHDTLKAFAVKVLERNTAARHACNSAPHTVSQTGATNDGPMQHPCDTPELAPLPGRIDGRGNFVLTADAIPALAERLRLQGWKVTRRGNELICTSPRTMTAQ